MSRLIRFAVARPKPIVAVWLAVVVVLGIFGASVEKRLSPSDIRVEGTQSSRAAGLHEGHYGFPLVVLLQGPRREIETQGPRLAARLRALPEVRVLTPWDGRIEAKRLTVSGGGALLAVDAVPPKGKTPFDVVAPVRDAVAKSISGPVTATVTGQPAIGLGLNDAVVKATRSAEKLALPILVLVLLLVFRSPIAAAIPVVVAIGTVLSGFGVIALVASSTTVDAIALSVASMIGLALGVDYSLLIVSRFRELLRDGDLSARDAALQAGLTAGRTTVFAGAVLLLVMAVPLLLSPGTILFSAALGAMIVAVLSMVGSILVTPSILTLLGHRVNRFQLGKPATSDGGKAAALGRRVARRPVLATGLLLAALLALAAPSLASKTAAPDVAQLPPDNSERQAYETVRNAIGPGWMAVLDISVNSPSRPLTDPRMLDALDRYQSRIANLPDVELVVGPGALRRAESRIRRIPVRLADLSRQLKHGRRGARRLQSGLGRAKRGVQSVRTGIGAAANGASRIADGAHVAGDGGRQLATGSRRTHEGATILRDGLGLLAGGARRLSGGLARAHSGAQQLRSGSSDAGGGAQRLVDGLEEAGTGAAQLSDGATQLATGLDDGASGLAQLRQPAQVAQSELEKAYAGLNEMSVGKGDPKYVETLISVRKALAAVSGRDPATGAPVAPGYDGLDPALATAVSKLREGSVAAHRLAAGATELESGIVRLRDGATRLRDGLGTLGAGQDRLTTGLSRLYSGNQAGIEGVDRLYRGEGALAGALTRVSQGADHLSTGMSSLESALGTLAGGLTSGRSQSRPLAGGLALMGAAVQRFRTGLQSGDIKGFERIQRRLPGLFRSGYLPLAAVDGSRLQPRRLARVVLDYDKGGQTGRVLVTPRTSANDPRTGQLIARLTALTERFQRETGARAAVGGAPAEFADYVNAMAGSLPLLIGAIALLTFVGLVPIVRAIPLAFVAVLLNLLTVGAAVGVLTLAFVGANPPLGGPGAIDIVAVSAIFAITFALSIDYEVFLLSRMREEYARSGDPDAAVAHGLRGTAHVVTGAALIMVGVFSAFSLSSFVTISQFGVGLGTAVLLDATVVRLLLLPAIMRLLGKRAWWLPQWLDRAMPTFDVEGTARPPRLTPRPKLVGVAK